MPTTRHCSIQALEQDALCLCMNAACLSNLGNARYTDAGPIGNIGSSSRGMQLPLHSTPAEDFQGREEPLRRPLANCTNESLKHALQPTEAQRSRPKEARALDPEHLAKNSRRLQLVNLLSSPLRHVYDMADTHLGESRSAVMLWCIWPFAAINLLSLFPRLYARIVHSIVTVLAIALTFCKTSSLAYSIVCTFGASNGLGRHLEYVQQSKQHNLQDARLTKLIACDLGIAACALGKTSYAVTQWRITRSATKSKMRAALFSVVALMDLINLLDAIFVFAQCRDPRHLWIPSIPTTCEHFKVSLRHLSRAKCLVLDQTA
ncbi:hypothetical protein KC355_g7 [Hortaea werneckii]|nr:hypothetical protein KC355_g7 [Hortaea werneckii]